MAASVIATKIKVAVETKGLDSAVQLSEKFHDNLVKGSAAIASAFRDTAKTASKVASDIANEQPVSAKARPKKSKDTSSNETDDYGASRALRPGGTGASARDFAKESAGLGGLVRLYATYAANVFAVGAAYRALSSAMDTTNMIRGLDQLGAASGMALGSLSKQLVKVTDGAISLREAMESVAKASSSGMSSNNILRMGKVAKQASQALGVDMSDAVNRLTRGITKLEPELLDELGIFTRVDSAVKEYAKSVGKSTAAITDFERRAAFGNAVLAEGERKFGEIDMETNPYTQLLASVKDLGHAGLELINKVLAPMVRFLAESPAALAVAIGAVGLALVKQAVPAIGQFKQAMQAQAEASKELADSRIADAHRAATTINQINTDAAARRAVEAEEHLGRIERLGKARISASPSLSGLMASDFAVEPRAELEDRIAAAQKDRMRVEAELNKERARGTAQDIVRVAHLREEIKLYDESTLAAKSAMEMHERWRDEDTKALGRNIVMKSTQRIADRAAHEAVKQEITTNAVYNSGLIGRRDALALMRVEMEQSRHSFTKMETAMMLAKANTLGFAASVMTVANAFSNLLNVVGLVITAVGILDSIMSSSKADNALGAYNDSLKRAEKAAISLEATIDRMNRVSKFSTSALQAQATATQEVSDSIRELSTNAAKATKELDSATWNKAFDIAKSIFNMDTKSKFGKGLSDLVVTSVQQLSEGPVSTKIKEDLASILKLDNVDNLDVVREKISKLAPGSETIRQIEKAFTASYMAAGTAASKASEYGESLKKARESYMALGKSFEVTDALTTSVSNNIDALAKLSNVLSGPIENSIGELADTLNNLDSIPLFGSKKSLELHAFADDMATLQKAIQNNVTEVDNLEKKLAASKQKSSKIVKNDFYLLAASKQKSSKIVKNDFYAERGLDYSYKVADQYSIAEAKLKDDIQKAKATGDSLLAQASSIAAKVSGSINEGMARQVDLIALRLETSLAKGSTALMQKFYAAADIVPELASKQYDLKIQELGQEQTYLKAQLELIKEVRMNNALLAIANAEKAAESSFRTPEARNKAKEELDKAIKYKDNLEKVFTSPAGNLRSISSDLRNGASGLSQDQVKNLVEVASQVSGIQVSMAGISRSIQDVKLIEKPLDNLKNTFSKIERDTITPRKEALELATQQLKLDKESGRFSEIELLAKDLTLQQEKSSLEYAQVALAARKDNLSAQIIVDGMLASSSSAQTKKDAQELKTASDILLNNRLTAASKKEATEASTRQAFLLSEMLKMEEARVQQNRMLEDIASSTQSSATAYMDSMNDLSVTRIRRELELNRITETDAAKSFALLDKEKATREYLLTLREKERDFIRSEEDLDRKYEAATTSNQRERIVAEGKARAQSYASEISNINETHKLKLTKIDEALEYELAARKRSTEKTIAEALVAGMTKGAKEGTKVLREFLANEFRRTLTIKVQAEITKTNAGNLTNIASDLLGTTIGGFGTYSLGSSLTKGLESAGFSMISEGFGDLGANLLNASSSIGDFSGMLDTAGAGLSILGTAMSGDYGAAIGEAIGYAVGGPFGAMAGKFLGSMLGLTDDSGTLHTGGAASYSATQGSRTGRGVMDELSFGVEVNESAQQAAAGLAQGLVSLLDSTAVTFGKEAGYYAATGFADDTSKDGAWGALSIKLGEKMILDWGKGADKWPGREFADGAEGQKEYLNAIAVDTKKVLMDMDLPTWADNILNAIGDSPTIEMLQAAMNQISKLNTVFDTFSEALGWSRESLEKLLGPLGGVDSAITKLGFYYENFFTDTEKLSRATEKLDDKFEKMGKAVPKTTEGFRSLVDAAQAAGDGALVNSLLEVAPAFVQVTKAIKEAAEAAREAARLMNAAWADVLETRGVDSSNFAAQADINAAWKQYQETDKYAQTSPTNFKTITFDDFTKNYTTEQQQLIARILKGYDTLNKSLLKNAEAALSTLKKSLDAQKEVYKEQLTVQEGLVTKLKGIFDSLQVHIDELYRNVVSTSNLSIIEGNRLIDSVISTRVLPESDTLMKAVEAAKSGTVDTSYSSRFDAERDRLILAGKLTDIQSIAKTELTAAELQVKYLKDQIDLLDRIYLENELAVQTLQGINESVLSVTDAVNALKQAMLDAKAPTTPTTSTAATGAGFVIGGTSPGASFGPGASTNPTDNYAPGQRGIGGNYLAEHYMGSYGSVFNEVDSTKQSQLEGVAAILQPFDGTGDVYGAAMAVKEAGGTMTDIASVMGYSYLDVFNALTEAGVPRFATGGDHFGGVRLVGEEGPELEFTGPSRILNNRQTMDMFQNNTGEEMQKMREEFTKLTEAQLKQSQEISRLFKRWDSDGLPSTRVEV